jgi:hypothetical protein
VRGGHSRAVADKITRGAEGIGSVSLRVMSFFSASASVLRSPSFSPQNPALLLGVLLLARLVLPPPRDLRVAVGAQVVRELDGAARGAVGEVWRES